MTRTFLCLALVWSASQLAAQSVENTSPEESMIKLAEAYPLETRMAIAAAERALLLNNTGPVTTTTWENMGPNTMDTLSGRVVTMAMDPSDPDRLYIGSGSGGMWTSPDGGQSWSPLTDALPSPHVSAIAVNPQNPDMILMGTGIGQAPTSTLAVGIGVLKSEDGGDTWSPTGFSYSQSAQVSVYEIIWHEETDVIYLAATNGLFVSADGGDTWEPALPNVRIYDVEIHPEDPSVIFAAVLNQGIRKSTDGGQTWQNVSTGMPFGSQVSRCGITICQSDPEVMYASLIASANFGLLGVYKSTDGGDSWAQLTNAPAFPCQPSNPSSCTGWLFHDIAVAPDNPDKVLIGSVQYWHSDDGGASWQWRDYASNGSGGGNVGLTYVDTWKFQFRPDTPGVVYTCNDGGVQKSEDYGQNWVRMGQGLIIGQAYSIATRPTDAEFMIGGFHDHGLQRLISTDDNTTWTRWSLGDGIQTAIDHQNDNVLYGNFQNGTPYKSITSGSNSTSTFPITNGIDGPGVWNTPLEMHPEDSDVLFTSNNNNLYRTTNGGLSWQPVLSAATVQSIVINPLQPDTMYAHAYNSTGWSFWRSYNMGTDWEQMFPFNMPTWGVADLECSPHDAATMYAVRNSTLSNVDHVKVSYDNGITWTDITNNLPDIKVRNILVSPLSPDHLYLATALGVYISTDAGECWQQWNFNLPVVEVYDVDYSPADQSIRIATMGRGVWKTPALNPLSTNDTAIENLNLTLYPNPAGEKLYVRMELKAPEQVRLSLLNEWGQPVKDWRFNVNEGPEEMELDLSGLNLSGGAYFLRAEIKGRAVHRKVVVR